MIVLFLDFDGVINNDSTWGIPPPSPDGLLVIPVEPACIARLNALVERTGARLVISSSWRRFAGWEDLGAALARHGVIAEVIGETPDLVNNAGWLERWRLRDGAPFQYERMQRGWEIREWLAAHPEVTEFAILDDCSDMDDLKPWLVLTDPVYGLDDPDVERAVWLLPRSSLALADVRSKAIGFP